MSVLFKNTNLDSSEFPQDDANVERPKSRVYILQLFVGLGFPYEGPAPLEAIANGCAFLNPKFNPPKSSKNTDFFKGKPTLREVSFYL